MNFPPSVELLFELDECSGEDEGEAEAGPPGEAGLAQRPAHQEREDKFEAVGDGDHDGDLGVVDQGVDKGHRSCQKKSEGQKSLMYI